MLNGNSMSFGKRIGWLAGLVLMGAGCAAQVGGPEESVGDDQAALATPAPLVPQGGVDAPQNTLQVRGLILPKTGATRAPVDPGAAEVTGDNGEPQPNPWVGGGSADDGDDREPQPNPWLGRRGIDDQPQPWNPVRIPGPKP